MEVKVQRNTAAILEIKVAHQYYLASLTEQWCEKEYSCILRCPTSADPYLSRFSLTRDPGGFVLNSEMKNVFAKVVTGSYYGTNAYGEDNKNSVALPGKPALFIVQCDIRSSSNNTRGAFWVRDSNVMLPIHMSDFSDTHAMSDVIWNATTSALEWYNGNSAANQMNSVVKYVYTAIY
jgi:hypothetical protein